MTGQRRQIVLNKGSEKYIFRYKAGSESSLLDTFIAQAQKGHTDFDWFDAAVLSFKLTESLITQADTILHRDAPQVPKKLTET